MSVNFVIESDTLVYNKGHKEGKEKNVGTDCMISDVLISNEIYFLDVSNAAEFRNYYDQM